MKPTQQHVVEVEGEEDHDVNKDKGSFSVSEMQHLYRLVLLVVLVVVAVVLTSSCVPYPFCFQIYLEFQVAVWHSNANDIGEEAKGRIVEQVPLIIQIHTVLKFV